MKKLISILLILLPILSCSEDEKKNSKEFFVFEPDIRLFISYAFMNAAGFNHDWNDNMHPIRLEVRNYLDSVLTSDYKKKINRFYIDMGGGDFYGYGVYALNSKNSPHFGLICNTCKIETIDKFVGYDTLLHDFYNGANIPKLWSKYKEDIHEMNLQYKPYAEIALKQITNYCRVDSNYYRNIAKGNFYYQQMPLMSYYTAFFHETRDDYWVISGPSNGKPGPGGFYHESLHKIINPIVENNLEVNKRIEDLVPLSQEQLKDNYNSITSMLCESFVRAIDKILTAQFHQMNNDKLRQMIEDEYRLGHILTFYLFENLPKYEKTNKKLAEYYPELIENIDLEYEKSRWIAYWKNQKDGLNR